MREIDIFSEKCAERVQCIQGRSASGFMPTSEDTSGIHMVGCEGKKGCMGVGDGTKVWGDGEGARWHMVLMFLSGV